MNIGIRVIFQIAYTKNAEETGDGILDIPLFYICVSLPI